MPETDAFALAYGRLSATTVRSGGPVPEGRRPTATGADERRSLLLPRLAHLRPKPVRRVPARTMD